MKRIELQPAERFRNPTIGQMRVIHRVLVLLKAGKPEPAALLLRAMFDEETLDLIDRIRVRPEDVERYG